MSRDGVESGESTKLRSNILIPNTPTCREGTMFDSEYPPVIGEAPRRRCMNLLPDVRLHWSRPAPSFVPRHNQHIEASNRKYTGDIPMKHPRRRRLQIDSERSWPAHLVS